MAEHEFERFLAVLSKLLKLSSKETAAIADELCDHLEERYSELVGLGISRDDAVRQALDEFEDAGELASKLNQLVKQRTRRRMMTGALTTAAVSAAAILATTAFWPVQQQQGGPTTAVVAQEQAQTDTKAKVEDEVVYVEGASFLPRAMSKLVEMEFREVSLADFAKYVQDLTGYAVLLDTTALTEAGVGAENELSFNAFGAPLYLVLSRVLEDVGGTELDWYLDDEVLHITTRDRTGTIQSPLTLDVSTLLDGGFSMQQLITVLEVNCSGPWLNVDGEGGGLIPVGSRLTIYAGHHTQREAQAILGALQTPGRRIAVDQPELHRRIQQGLTKRVTCNFQGISIGDVLNNLAQQADIPVLMDTTALQEAGVDSMTEVTLSVPENSLRSILKLLLRDVGGTELASLSMNGVLLITTRDKADTIQSVEIFDAADLVGPGEMQELINLLEHATAGPWHNIDGEGGSLTPLSGQRVIARQTQAGLDSINKLLNDHRRTARARPPRPNPDPNTIEVRYYRMTEAQANDLKEIIPRFVAIDSWEKFSDGSKPQIDKVSLSGIPNGPGGFGGGGLGGGGMGGGAGGGLFQIGGEPQKETTNAATQQLLKELIAELKKDEPDTKPTAVLVVRQTRRVHTEIEKFLRDLAEKSWSGGEWPSNTGMGGGFFRIAQ